MPYDINKERLFKVIYSDKAVCFYLIVTRLNTITLESDFGFSDANKLTECGLVTNNKKVESKILSIKIPAACGIVNRINRFVLFDNDFIIFP